MKPISLKPKKSNRKWFWIAAGVIVIIAVVGYFALPRILYLFGSSGAARWLKYTSWQKDPGLAEQIRLDAGGKCEGAPFQFPTTGVVFGLWKESYRPGHIHSGIDIFPGTEVGETPIFAAYDGYLTREADWKSTVIIRIPEDPLQPNRQIWTYYTHMADQQGNPLIAEEFPMGTFEVWVEAGTFLGYVGNYSGSPVNPTGIHLHFSVVKDDGRGGYLNELDIDNVLDPSPYFGLPLNQDDNPNGFPTCAGVVE